MKLTRLFVLSLYVVACALGGVLFLVSQRVQDARYELAALQRNIEEQHHTIQVLRAEWDYLNSPARLEFLARNYFGFGAPKTEQVVTDLDHFQTLIPSIYPTTKPSVFSQNVVPASLSGHPFSSMDRDVLSRPYFPPKKNDVPSTQLTGGAIE